MSQLLVCHRLGGAEAMTVKRFARAFERDETALRAAFLALTFEKPVRFHAAGAQHIVLRHNPQLVHHTGRDLAPEALTEAEITLDGLCAPEEPSGLLAAPEPPPWDDPSELPAERVDVYRITCAFEARWPVSAFLVATSVDDASRKFEQHYPRMKEMLADSLRQEAGQQIRSRNIPRDLVEIRSIAVAPDERPVDYPVLT